MTDRNRLLQEAWRELAGWHVGMVLCGHGPGRRCIVDARMVRQFKDGEGPLVFGSPPYWAIDLDSPANWGHWAEALAERFGHASLEIVRGGFAYGDVGKGDADDTPAVALMLAACRHMLVCREQMPPAVLAWWKAEDEASDG